MNTLNIGTILKGKHHYTLTKVLGMGGFGITYKAEREILDGNISHKAYYAIKEFYPQEICCRQPDGTVECKSETFKDQFKAQKEEFCKEAKLLRDVCKHENIVSVNEVIEQGGTVYYVMQCINGDTLTQYTAKHKDEAKIDDIVEIITAIGHGLEFLHSHKIAHLDIKPDNIILTESGLPVIIDFGLARHYNKRDNLTHLHAFIGCSDGYSPAEQYMGIETFSPKTDTYALAATMLFMLTTKQPPKAPGLTTEYIHSQLDGKCPDHIIEALVAATSIDIKQRSDLPSFLAGLQTTPKGSRPEGVNHTTPMESEGSTHTKIIGYTPTKKEWFKRTPVIAIIVILLAIVVGGVVYKSCTGGTQEDSTTICVTDTTEVVNDTISTVIDTTETEIDTPEPEPTPAPEPAPKVVDRPYTWTGSYTGNKPDGEGTLTFKRDCTISGFHFKAGDKFKGIMDNGKIYSGDWYDANDNIKQKDIFGGN